MELPDSVAQTVIDVLEASQACLQGRLALVDSAIMRLLWLANEQERRQAAE